MVAVVMVPELRNTTVAIRNDVGSVSTPDSVHGPSCPLLARPTGSVKANPARSARIMSALDGISYLLGAGPAGRGAGDVQRHVPGGDRRDTAPDKLHQGRLEPQPLVDPADQHAGGDQVEPHPTVQAALNGGCTHPCGGGAEEAGDITDQHRVEDLNGTRVGGRSLGVEQVEADGLGQDSAHGFSLPYRGQLIRPTPTHTVQFSITSESRPLALRCLVPSSQYL